jgi:hypothetical protein
MLFAWEDEQGVGYDLQDGITTSTCGSTRCLASSDEVFLTIVDFVGMLTIGVVTRPGCTFTPEFGLQLNAACAYPLLT